MPADWRRLTDKAHDRDELRVKLLGVFDTVGALGIPAGASRWRFNRDENGFHDVELSSITDVNLHAVAIDEHRWPFEATLWRQPPFKKYDTKVEQVWFSGAHSDVGGGYIEEERRGEAPHADDVTLDWIVQRTKRFYPDFPFDLGHGAGAVEERKRAELHNSRSAVYHAWRFAIRSIANTKIEASFWSHQKEVSRDRHAHPIGEKIHISALQRLFPDPDPSGSSPAKPYKPTNLQKVLEAIELTYKPGEGDDGEPEAGSDGATTPAFSLPVVDWDGHDIPKHGPRAERLRQLLARRAREVAKAVPPGALQRA